jgi:mevalonate kinase
MSGGGRGGNMIALAKADTSESVSEALIHAGAKNVIVTTVEN